MIFVLDPSANANVVLEVEAEVRRAGGDPRRLTGAREAIECRGPLAPADIEAISKRPGVAFVLEAKPMHPKVSGTAGEPIRVGRAAFGGTPKSRELVIIAGPCAVESEAQLETCARAAAAAGATLLRGGAFKPRTSPYSFQGQGEEGLRLLRRVADANGLAVVTEVMSPEVVPLVSEHAEMLQIGSRNMQNFALLREVGKSSRAVLLKRGMSATLEEWLLAAEYIADAGNERIVLCERGVRSFDAAARNLLDLSAVPLLRARTKLPVVVDPSHGVGVRSAIPAMAYAAAAAGADGLMLECHPDPGHAKSDGFQALLPEQLRVIADKARALAALVRE